jgi:integrase
MARLPKRGFFKRGAVWWCRTDPVTKRPTSTGCKTSDAAAAWLKQRESLAANPEHAAAQEAKLGLWVQQTIALKMSTSSPSTVEVYTQKLGHFIRLLGAARPLAEINPPRIDLYVENRRGEGVTDHTISKELNCLNQLLKLAKRAGCYPGDILALRPLSIRVGYVPQTRVLTRQELLRLLANLEPGRGAYVALCVGLGVRRSEVERLLPTDFNWEKGEVFIGGTKTDGSRRTVPILSLYRPMLEAAQQYLPVGRWGNAIRDLAIACRRAGIVRVTRNDLRRTHATMLHDAGVDRDTIRRLLGHSTTAMVDRVYAQPSAESLSVLAERQLVRSEPIQIRYTRTEQAHKTALATLAQLVEQRFRKPVSDESDNADLAVSRGFSGCGESREAQRAGRGAQKRYSRERREPVGCAHDPLELPSLASLARAAVRMGVIRAD